MYKFDCKAGWNTVVGHIESQLLPKGFFIEASETIDSDNSLRFYLSEDRLTLVQLIQTKLSESLKKIVKTHVAEFNIGISKMETPYPE